jgi:hypothetical protein
MIGIPPEGLGSRLDQIIAWLDANCGADAWAIAPSGIRSVVNDALAIYFLEATITSALDARWCAAERVEILDGVYRVWDDEATPRIGTALPRTPCADVASPISTGASPLMQLTAYLGEAETRGETRQAEHPRDPASLR